MLDGKGAILDVARRVSRVLEAGDSRGAIIGGVAVVLHGHIRTTLDVDVYINEPPAVFARQLQEAGFTFAPKSREFLCDGVPVHLVTAEQVAIEPKKRVVIDEIRTISLADLINLKLDSGTKNLLRAQDLADVIGLIRAHRLGGDFAARIHKPLRSEFRRLARAVRNGSKKL